MSTIKVDTVDTRTGTGNITFSRPTVLQAGDIVTADIAADAIDGTKLADNACNSEHYTDGSIDLVHLQTGTDGELITWDASGNPAAVAVGTSTHVLTSGGAGVAPTFQAGGSITDAKFLAGLTSTASNVTGNGTSYSTAGKTWTEIYDTGSDFASGTFTAPETGKYILFGSFYMNGITSAMTQQIIYIVTSNRSYNAFRGHGHNVMVPGQGSFLWCLVADMDASDTFHATIVFYSGNLEGDVLGNNGSAQNNTYMGAALIG
jgi:hypothetical protein